MPKRKDPKVGTGKKPKGSGRRLYTDENPKTPKPQNPFEVDYNNFLRWIICRR